MPDPQAPTQPQPAPQQTQQPSAPQSTPMIAPDYSSTKMVPADQVADAQRAGWDLAVKMQGPKGEMKWVPSKQVQDARQQKYAVHEDNAGVRPMISPAGEHAFALPQEVEGFVRSGYIPDMTRDEMSVVSKAVAAGDWKTVRNIQETKDSTGHSLRDYQMMRMSSSPTVRSQLATGAAGSALIAAPFAVTGAAEAGSALTAARPIVQQVGTGIMDSAGKEIMKDVTTMGPSILRSAATRAGASWLTKLAKWGTGLGGGIGVGVAGDAAYDALKEKLFGK